METVTIHDRKFRLSITPETISATVSEIAKKLNEDLKEKNVLLVPVLNGAFMFASDLIKKLYIPCQISFVKLSSYRGMSSLGVIDSIIGLTDDAKNKTVVILEDIIDSGRTLQSLISEIRKKKPAEIIVVTLLFKPGKFSNKFKIDYIGFRIPDDFVIGYGLDYDGLGRNLNGVYTAIENSVT